MQSARSGNHRACGTLALTLALCLLGFGAPLAGEPTTEIAAGGLTYAGQQTLITRQEAIAIASDRIRVTYTLQNAEPETRTALMAFALPDIDLLALDGATIDNPAYDAKNPMNFVGFAALVDEQPAEIYVDIRALSLGLVDISRVLRELALPFYPLHPDIGARLAALPEVAKADLLARSAIRITDGQYEPLWTLKTTLFWQQQFAAGQTRKIAISYSPIAGGSVATRDLVANLQPRFCLSAEVAADLSRRGGADAARLKWTHYLASAGANARGSVADYRVAIETAPKQAAYTCRAGLVSSAAAGSRETREADVIPEDDVQVLFVDP